MKSYFNRSWKDIIFAILFRTPIGIKNDGWRYLLKQIH